MWPVAQTNLQLYNQLRGRGWPQAELGLVHRAYELTVSLYSGYFQSDGKPFVAHTVGVASVLGHLGRPAEVVAAGLLHNVYTNADFGDGRIYSARTARRRIVQRGAGERVEAIVYGFLREMRLKPHTRIYDQQRPDVLASIDPDLVLLDLADALEKHVDGGVLYIGDRDAYLRNAALEKDGMVAAALKLGHPELASALTEAIDATLAASIEDYASLQPSDGRHNLRLIVPRSCIELPHLVLRQRLRELRNFWRRFGMRPATVVRLTPADSTLAAEVPAAPAGDSGRSVL